MSIMNSKIHAPVATETGRNYFLTLQTKVLILITLTVVVISGIISILFLNFFMKEMIDELQKRGDSTVEHIALDSYFPLLTEDSVLLAQLVQSKLSQPEVEYIVLLNKDKVILHSSGDQFETHNFNDKPHKTLKEKYSGLLSLLKLKEGALVDFSRDVWQKERNETDEFIGDSTFEVDDGAVNKNTNVKLGTVHVGFSLEGLRDTLIYLIWTGLATSLAVVILIVFILFMVIHNKIATIILVSKVAREVAANQDENFVITADEFSEIQHSSIFADDEINDLYFSFKNMLNQLNTYHHFMRENTKELEQAYSAKSNFLSNISHEFRTPLNAIIGYCDLILMDYEDGEIPSIDDTKKINKAADHLLNLINGVLDISKMDAGKDELFLEEIDIKQIIHDSVGICRILAGDNHNEIHINIDEDIDFMTSDKTKLSQCLINLLGNSCKFTKGGHITVSVYKEVRNKVTFSIKDTGIGIAPEKIEKVIFDPFSQADNSITRNYGGTGLGLTVTKKLIELLGGEISVQSEVGVGTEISFWLNV